MSTAGEIIYKGRLTVATLLTTAFSPNLKILGCVALGYIIVKQGIFTPASAKGVSILAIVSAASNLAQSECLPPSAHLFLHRHCIHTRQHFRLWLFGHGRYTLPNPRSVTRIHRQRGLLHSDGFSMGRLGGESLSKIALTLDGMHFQLGQSPNRHRPDHGSQGPFSRSSRCRLGHRLRLVSRNTYTADHRVFVLIMNTLFFPLGLHKVNPSLTIAHASSAPSTFVKPTSPALLLCHSSSDGLPGFKPCVAIQRPRYHQRLKKHL